MTVALDVATESERTGTTDPHTHNHTSGASAKAGVLAAVHGTSNTDHVTGPVTWGGVPMTRIVRATDSTTEPGAAELWFVGRGFLTGLQTISADLASATTDDIHFVSWSINAVCDCEVIDFDSINDNVANPTVTLQKGGREGICLGALYSGGATPAGATGIAAGNTAGPNFDMTAFYSDTLTETTVDNADHTIGWTTLGTDDVAFVALCVSERPARRPDTDHYNPALMMRALREGWERRRGILVPRLWLPEGVVA